MAFKITKEIKLDKTKYLMFFETDKDFEDFAVQPYAKLDESLCGEYTDLYKKAIEMGVKFVIMKGSFESAINRRKIVTKRVLIPKELGSPRKDVLIQLPVENILDSYMEGVEKLYTVIEINELSI